MVLLTKFVSNAVLNPRAEKDGKNVVASKDDKNPHTKLKMTKMSHHQKRWQKVAPQERWQKYVAPPRKSRIVKKMTKNVVKSAKTD